MSEFTTTYQLLMLVMIGVITYIEVYSLLRIKKQDKKLEQQNIAAFNRSDPIMRPIRVGPANADPIDPQRISTPITIPNLNNYSSFNPVK